MVASPRRSACLFVSGSARAGSEEIEIDVQVVLTIRFLLPSPYKDPCMMGAQVSALLALAGSCVYWIAFLDSFVTALAFGLVLFYRTSAEGMKLLAFGAGLSAVIVLAYGFFLLFWNDEEECYLLGILQDNCNQGAWAAISFASAFFWCLAAGLSHWFAKSGRHAAMEYKYIATSEEPEA